MRLPKLTALTLTLTGFTLRLYYLRNTHPFFDEYTTVLAARQILEYGWPVLPSGLFYEHGLLATYVIAPFTALFINQPAAQWQPAHWGLMLARWPSLLISTATIPLIYTLASRALSPIPAPIPLLAAGLFALSPEGMVWGGRARMYALATLLVWLTVYLAYRGATGPAPARYRWTALLALLATLLTQFGALMMVPPLVVAMVAAGWLSRSPRRRAWFSRPAVLLEGAALGSIITVAVLVKRLGQPLGAAPLDPAQSDALGAELLHTVAYQTALYFTWPDTVKFFAREFGVPHHFWLTLLALVGLVIGLVWWGVSPRGARPAASFTLFLGLVFGLIMLEVITLLEPFRRNPRYMVMYLPLFYLIAAHAIFNVRRLPDLLARLSRRVPRPNPLPGRMLASPVAAIGLLVILTALGYGDLRVALVTPEPAYDEAFAWLSTRRQPGDTLLTMNTSAAGLYLGGADGFTVQQDADQFLLKTGAAAVDRWLGVPWIGTAAAFNTALSHTSTTWFVIDTIRLPVYFRGDWLALVNTQMEQVWASDNALIYRTRDDRIPIPTQPDQPIGAVLGQAIRLVGYTLQPGAQPHTLRLTLFWQPRARLQLDYTNFIHLRNTDNATVAQWDGQPLDSAYPTSRWQPGETVIDPISLSLPANLPPGQYRLLTGLYRLDTLERLPVANDVTGENAVLLGEITLP